MAGDMGAAENFVWVHASSAAAAAPRGQALADGNSRTGIGLQTIRVPRRLLARNGDGHDDNDSGAFMGDRGKGDVEDAPSPNRYLQPAPRENSSNQSGRGRRASRPPALSPRSSVDVSVLSSPGGASTSGASAIEVWPSLRHSFKRSSGSRTNSPGQ